MARKEGHRSSIPVTETERDPIMDRDRVRKIMYRHVDTFLDMVLFTPATEKLNIDRCFEEMKGPIVTEVCGYRSREAVRARKQSPPDEDPAWLSCQMP